MLNLGACRSDLYDNNSACRSDFFAQMRLPELDFWPMFRLRNWKFSKFRHFEQNIGRFCHFWLHRGLVELKNAEKGVVGA